jgi:molybdopterin-guanine dinucleotide biosynthesis protein A
LQYLADEGRNNGLVLCPCDAPFIPGSLVQKLLDAGQAEEKPAVVISYQGALQPTFSLWQNQHLPVIREAVVNRGLGGIRQVLAFLPHKIVEWPPVEPSPFFNINTPADLETAASWLDRMQR